MKRFLITFVAIAVTCAVAAPVHAQSGRTLARLFWQNEDDATVRWADLTKNSEGYHLDEKQIESFPDLNDDEQSLVQMQADQGVMIVGVHDDAKGTIGSGWVGIDAGVKEIPHGDHSHWNYASPPSVLHTAIDTDQGNPAHVYRYGRSFVLANDQKNGFTIASSAAIGSSGSSKTPGQAATFYKGGNGHITLAVVEDTVAYATWIAFAGEDAGRVDVVGLGPNRDRSYHIQCPSGGLHGATVNSGKAFFAPADGVCWVTVDAEVDDDPESVAVHHLSLGKDADDKPLRTGAFTNLGKHVLFTAGKTDQAKLCVIDASASSPEICELAVPVEADQSLGTPIVIRSAKSGPLALMFAESSESPDSDQLWIARLDPNGDKDFSDAALVSPIDVGLGKISGHAGHHDAVMLPGGRQLALTNPGDGSIWIVSLSDYSVVGKVPVEGTPARLMVIPSAG